MASSLSARKGQSLTSGARLMDCFTVPAEWRHFCVREIPKAIFHCLSQLLICGLWLQVRRKVIGIIRRSKICCESQTSAPGCHSITQNSLFREFAVNDLR